MKELKKLLFLFDKKQKLKFVGVFFVVFIGSIFEMLGVSMLLPFIQALLNPDELMANRWIKILMNITKIDSAFELSVLLVMMMIAIYVVKNVYLIFSQYVQYQVIWHNKLKMENDVMEYYVRKPYLFHIQKNSSEIQRTILTDIGNVFTVVTEFFFLIAEGLTGIMLLILLLITSFSITIVLMLAIAGFLLLYFKVFKKRLYNYGKIAQEYGAEGLKCIHQVFNGIKEIKLHQCEKFFIKEFRDGRVRQSSMMKRAAFFQQIPKYVLEMTCIVGILGMLLVQMLSGMQLDVLIGQIAVFALAAYRILPSANRITYGMSVLYNNMASINLVYMAIREDDIDIHAEKDLEAELDNGVSEYHQNGNKNISLCNVTYNYPNNPVKILDDVSLEIEQGSSIAFIGPSGAGKTTTADLILGILKPVSGNIKYNGVDIEILNGEWNKKLGYIPQNIYLCDDTIRRNVAFGIENPNDERIWKALEEAQLKEFVENTAEGLDLQVGEGGVRLSGGQRQRIGIARALYNNPDILILDEATSALDNDTEQAVMQSIDYLKGKKTLIIIAHRLSTIEKCDKTYEVANGKIIRVK